jgi:F-type H+-transporting ATPase subunit epsilon
MADKVHFDLVTPDRLLLSSEVEMVVVPGAEGDFGVLPGHTPLISTLRHGTIDVHEDGKVARRLYVGGGFAEVSEKGVTVLAEDAIDLKDLSRADLEKRIKDASEDVEDAKDDAPRMKAQAKLDHFKALLAALG